jgi:hypothetical protein
LSRSRNDQKKEPETVFRGGLASGFGSTEAAESKLLGILELKANLEERVEAFNLLAQLYAQTACHRDALEYFASALAAGTWRGGTID